GSGPGAPCRGAPAPCRVRRKVRWRDHARAREGQDHHGEAGRIRCGGCIDSGLTVSESLGGATVGYHLVGDLLEVCDCNTLCPCWIGENPDNGTCQSSLAYRIERGEIEGLDVSGLVFATAVFIPGNVLAGQWRIIRYVDDLAS